MSASISTSVAPVGFDSFYEQIKDQPTFIVLGGTGFGNKSAFTNLDSGA